MRFFIWAVNSLGRWKRGWSSTAGEKRQSSWCNCSPGNMFSSACSHWSFYLLSRSTSLLYVNFSLIYLFFIHFSGSLGSRVLTFLLFQTSLLLRECRVTWPAYTQLIHLLPLHKSAPAAFIAPACHPSFVSFFSIFVCPLLHCLLSCVKNECTLHVGEHEFESNAFQWHFMSWAHIFVEKTGSTMETRKTMF